MVGTDDLAEVIPDIPIRSLRPCLTDAEAGRADLQGVQFAIPALVVNEANDRSHPHFANNVQVSEHLNEEIIMNSNMRTANPIALALSTLMLLACVLAISTAFADDEVRTETVKFQDLNVGTPAGVEALYRRIHAAAEYVCTRPGEKWASLVGAACARRAEAEGIAKVKLPSLTAYYQKRTGDYPQALAANR